MDARAQAFEFGDFRLDRRRRQLAFADGRRVNISDKAFDALVYFLEHPGVVVGRRALLNALWPDTVVEENNLSQTVAALRRTLGDGYVVTVRGRGYQLVADVRALGAVEGAGASDEGIASAAVAPRRARPYKRTFALIGAGVLVVSAIVALGTVLSSGRRLHDPGTPPRVVVLPCDNLSPAADDAYLALAMHQEILDQLGKLVGMLVISRSSVMQYATGRPPIPDIARAFDAQAVMECSVRRMSARLVLDVRLIDPATDSARWAQSYEGDAGELDMRVAMQSGLAVRVAASLGVDLSPGEQRSLDELPTRSPEAYAMFLKARQAMTEGGYSLGYSEEAFHEFIERAIAFDPAFATAYAYRGFGRLSRALDALRAAQVEPGVGASVAAVRAELETARADAQRALALDAGLGRAHALAGAVEVLTGDAAEARGHFDRVIELDRNDAEMLSFVAGFYLREGRRAEALGILERVERLSPVDHDVGYFFYLAGERRTAEQILRRVLEVDPAFDAAHANLGYLMSIEGRAEEAEPELRLAEALLRDDAAEAISPGQLSTLAYSYARIGLAADARRMADWFKEVAATRPTAPMRWTEVHLALGDVDSAYESATRMTETPLLPFVSLELEFVFDAYNDPVFEEPRFVELRRKLSSSELLWRESVILSPP